MDNIRKVAVVLVSISFVFIILPSSSMVKAAENNYRPEVFPLTSKPYGKTYSEWSALWWQWALSIPTNANPVKDTTGKNCAQGQKGPVWFLAGTFGGAIERFCTIPTGVTLATNPISQEVSYAEFPDSKTESDLRVKAKNFQDKVTHVEFTVNGVGIQNLSKYRVQSPLFSFALPKDNVLGLPAQTTQGVSDGTWVILHALPAGKYEIHSKGISVDFTETGVQNFVSDVTYHLTVVKP